MKITETRVSQGTTYYRLEGGNAWYTKEVYERYYNGKNK